MVIRKKNGELRDEDGRFVQGCSGGPGRPRGRQNKTTVDGRILRARILASFDRNDGDRLLDELAQANPLAYLKLISHYLPRGSTVRETPEYPNPESKFDDDFTD